MYLTNEQLTEILSQPIEVSVDWQHERISGEYEDGHIYDNQERVFTYFIKFYYYTTVNKFTPATHTNPSESEVELEVDDVEVFIYNPSEDDHEQVQLTDQQEISIAQHVEFI